MDKSTVNPLAELPDYQPNLSFMKTKTEKTHKQPKTKGLDS